MRYIVCVVQRYVHSAWRKKILIVRLVVTFTSYLAVSTCCMLYVVSCVFGVRFILSFCFSIWFFFFYFFSLCFLFSFRTREIEKRKKETFYSLDCSFCVVAFNVCFVVAAVYFLCSCLSCRLPFVYILSNKIYFLCVEIELVWHTTCIAYGMDHFQFLSLSPSISPVNQGGLSRTNEPAHISSSTTYIRFHGVCLQNHFVSNGFGNFLRLIHIYLSWCVCVCVWSLGLVWWEFTFLLDRVHFLVLSTNRRFFFLFFPL